MSDTLVHPKFHAFQGSAPLLISIPHVGQHIPQSIASRMADVAKRLDDTDWHLDQLYQFAHTLKASTVMATHSRYVIDPNRPPDGASLYPGQSTTGLCPIDTFGDEALYLPGQDPDEAEQKERLQRYWQPYHEALRTEIDRIKAEHGYVLLWEAHSIRSHIPRLFEGRLPDFNFGTADDTSTAPGLAQALVDYVQSQSPYTAVANGRFKGGYITRHYGRPAQGIHAIQLELAQITYMDETPPYAYDETRAQQLAPIIQGAIERALTHISGLY